MKVEVAPFWIGKYEVTWAEYKHFMKLCNVFEGFEDQGMRPVTKDNQIDAVTGPSKLYDPSFTYQSGEEPDKPAVSMSQFAAKQYTKWLSLLTGEFYRLPTESEWEYACRAGSQSDYYFGDDAEALGAIRLVRRQRRLRDARSGPEATQRLGLYDMAGNASEWVMDEFRSIGMRVSKDGLSRQMKLFVGLKKLYPRVLRGGSINSPPSIADASRRASNDDELRSYDPNTPKALGGLPVMKPSTSAFASSGHLKQAIAGRARKILAGGCAVNLSRCQPGESFKKAAENADLSIRNFPRRSKNCSKFVRKQRNLNDGRHHIRSEFAMFAHAFGSRRLRVRAAL